LALGMKHLQLKRLFIANRGEILRRIAFTAKNMGIATVSVWQDRQPPPGVLRAVIDKFVFVPQTSNVYLDQNRLIEAAKAEGCDSVHPGFGFLSENATFAQACIDAGLIWVGPNPASMTIMASKDTSRTVAIKSN